MVCPIQYDVATTCIVLLDLGLNRALLFTKIIRHDTQKYKILESKKGVIQTKGFIQQATLGVSSCTYRRKGNRFDVNVFGVKSFGFTFSHAGDR